MHIIIHIIIHIFWLVVSTPLKNMNISWDYSSQYMESHKIPWFQSTNQYSICGGFLKLGTRLDFHEHLMFNQTRCMYTYIYIYTHTKKKNTY